MKMWWGLLTIGGALLLGPAAAAPWDYRPGLQAQQDRRQPSPQAPAYRGDRREPRAVPERNDRPRQRLNDEERRELRRDLDRANRELYRRKGQR